METLIVPINQKLVDSGLLQNLIKQRTMSAEDWVETHASGTLRKNKRLGMTWRAQYLEERTAYQFGWEFQIQPRSRIMFGDAFTEGDASAVTEAGWHIERYLESKVFEEDFYQCKYINVAYSDGTSKEGIGIVVRQTSAQWVPSGHIVFAIVAEFDKASGEWMHAQNPF